MKPQKIDGTYTVKKEAKTSGVLVVLCSCHATSHDSPMSQTATHTWYANEYEGYLPTVPGTTSSTVPGGIVSLFRWYRED